MESKFINRYNTFCRSLEKFRKKSRTADAERDCVFRLKLLFCDF